MNVQSLAVTPGASSYHDYNLGKRDLVVGADLSRLVGHRGPRTSPQGHLWLKLTCMAWAWEPEGPLRGQEQAGVAGP